MTSVVELLSMDNPVFRAYGFWASVMIMKVLVMAALTSRIKRKKNVRSIIFADEIIVLILKLFFCDFSLSLMQRTQRCQVRQLQNSMPEIQMLNEFKGKLISQFQKQTF